MPISILDTKRVPRCPLLPQHSHDPAPGVRIAWTPAPCVRGVSVLTFEICQKVLKIHDFPVYLEKEIIFDFVETHRSKWMQEKTLFLNQGDLRSRVQSAGYLKSNEQDFIWYRSSEESKYKLHACIVFEDAKNAIELTLIKEGKGQTTQN